jgi:hypothetical protein
VIPTPALDRIARDALRYTNFHSTALCSPARAALITGRKHHSAGFGVISGQATGDLGIERTLIRHQVQRRVGGRPNPEIRPARKIGYFFTSGHSLASSGLAASSGGIVATSL